MSSLLSQIKVMKGLQDSSSGKRGANSESTSRRSKKKKSMKGALTASAGAEPSGLSKYTGLPKGVGDPSSQERIIQDWVDSKLKFLSSGKLLLLTKENKFEVPTSKRRVNRINAMIDCGTRYGIEGLTLDTVCALACAKHPIRKYYDILCSLYGIECRQKQATKSEFGAYASLAEDSASDTSEIREARALLRWGVKKRKELQVSWQKKVQAFRSHHADEIEEMRKLEVAMANIKAELSGFKLTDEDLVTIQVDPLFGGGSRGGDEISESEAEADDVSKAGEAEDRT